MTLNLNGRRCCRNCVVDSLTFLDDLTRWILRFFSFFFFAISNQGAHTSSRISGSSADSDSDVASSTPLLSKKSDAKSNDRVSKFIYTDSEEESSDRRGDASSSAVRTKAAVKAFSPVTTSATSRGRGKKTVEVNSSFRSTY